MTQATLYIGLNISIHAPPRGATSPRCARICLTIFQFTPLREGRQVGMTLYIVSEYISIHAPPRGATQEERTGFVIDNISIHAPPRGATRRFA